ncbi:MAG: DUF3160 domain-containing protein, partial [Phycisphaerae bacterium]
LQSPPPRQAPAALHTAAWRDKQLCTQLGAWAEQRHTWALHAKCNVAVFGGAFGSPGYISPYPEFFEGLGGLARATAAALRRAGLAQALAPRALADSLLTHAQRAGRHAVLRAGVLDGDMKAEAELARTEAELAPSAGLVMRLRFELDDSRNAFFDGVEGEDERPAAKRCEALARKCLAGEKLTAQEAEVLAAYGRLDAAGVELIEDFGGFCGRLAGAARRQLTKEGITKEDAELIGDYGVKLARFHHYTDQAYLYPRDDLPIISPIYVSPPGNRREALYAAVARPRAVYVIVENGEKAVLHRGAVLTYHEIRRALDQPIDDEGWRREVCAGRTPPLPSFTRSFAASITEDEVVQVLRGGGFYPAMGAVPGRKITLALMDRLGRAGLGARDPRWHDCVEMLSGRCRAEDAGRLLEIIRGNRIGHVQPLVREVGRLRWAPHRPALLEMLRGPEPNHADAAAYVLSRRPADIDLADLVSDFGDCPDRTRRLYAYLLGFTGKATGAARRCLLGSLRDKAAGVRFQAAKAAGSLSGGDDDLIGALIERIGDENEFVAAEAAWTLRRWNRAEAAPAMLDRFRRGVRFISAAGGRRFLDPGDLPRDPQREAILADTRSYPKTCSEFEEWRILAGAFGFRLKLRTLAETLYRALAAFRYRPAIPSLEKRATGPDCREAIVALGRIDPEGQKARLEGLLREPAGVAALRALGEL